MKKWISILLILAILASTMVTAAFAAETSAVVSGSQPEGSKGDVVTVQIRIDDVEVDGVPGYKAYQIMAKFDSTALKVVDAKASRMTTFNTKMDGMVVASFASATPVILNSDECTFSIDFEILAGSGTHEVFIEVGELFGDGNVRVPASNITVTHGSVTVVKTGCDHRYSGAVTVPTCTEQGYTTYTCVSCGDSYVADYVAALGHNWVGSECSRCGIMQSKYYVDVMLKNPESVNGAWVDGKQQTFRVIEGGIRVYLANEKATNLVIYSYNTPNAADPHTQYPTGMRVWVLKCTKGTYTATYVPEFDNLLQYSGSSIRIVGLKGIRMITSISKNKRNALMTKGLAGYTLEEYGTCLAWASDVNMDNPLVLGKDYTKSNFAYKKGKADPIFLDTGDQIQYTNVLVGFTDDQCIPDIVMRPYIILRNAQGQKLTIYGGQVCRSIGYIAWQNRNVFNAGTAAYEYVWDIIHHVYGEKYDAEYKG